MTGHGRQGERSMGVAGMALGMIDGGLAGALF
jgi:hypothetical protein